MRARLLCVAAALAGTCAAFPTAADEAAQDLTPAVAARLREHYPDDRATGYREGQIRGAIVATKPL